MIIYLKHKYLTYKYILLFMTYNQFRALLSIHLFLIYNKFKYAASLVV